MENVHWRSLSATYWPSCQAIKIVNPHLCRNSLSCADTYLIFQGQFWCHNSGSLTLQLSRQQKHLLRFPIDLGLVRLTLCICFVNTHYFPPGPLSAQLVEIWTFFGKRFIISTSWFTLYTDKCRYNEVRFITIISMALRWQEQNSNQTLNSQQTCEDVEEIWTRYNGTVL